MRVTDLSTLQARLEGHFQSLCDLRRSAPGAPPVFALEHNLDPTEVGALADAVRRHVSEAPPEWEHRLAWVVYAVELGYEYAGDEYWQTFEERTPGWERNGDRYWLRRCFSDFSRCFRGAEPSGAWARRFSLICWPIAHAILPKDLQRQLAKLLYDLRHVISSAELVSPARLGELIEVHSWRSSSRFQNLAQNPQLVGQIAAALLLHEEPIASSLILPRTLQRISEDLDRERRARTWMRGARQSAKRQVQLASGTTSGGSADGGATPEDPQPRAPRLGIEPRLILRPSRDVGCDWDAIVELPGLSHLPLRFPELRDPLLSLRCRVAGSSGRPWPLRQLLYGPRSVPLQRWPEETESLIQLERPHSSLEYLLRTECLIRPGPSWLFRIASDGLGYELRSGRVRPEQRYVQVDTRDREATHPCLRSTALSCEGATAVEIDIPDAIPTDLGLAIERLGLAQATSIRVWPAGLTPARWDGEGGVEWLASDVKCIGLRADHQVEAFVAELGGRILEVPCSDAGTSAFFELPHLHVGHHSLSLASKGPAVPDEEEFTVLDIWVREPRVWSPANSSQGALTVVVDPHAPTLEQLWDGHVNINVHGPKGRPVTPHVSFVKRGETTPTLERTLPGMRLPSGEDDWQQCLARLRDDRDVQNAYDVAHTAELRLSARELGVFTLVVEREFTPLRWARRRTSDGYHLKLIDDTGSEAALAVTFYPFATPDSGAPADVGRCLTSRGLEADEGLYLATSAGVSSAIVIPPIIESLQDLRVAPRLRVYARRPTELTELLKIADFWAGARLTGDLLSRLHRRDVMEALSAAWFRLVCGLRWGEVEERIRGGECDPIALALGAFVPTSPEADVALNLSQHAGRFAALGPSERSERLVDLVRSIIGPSESNAILREPPDPDASGVDVSGPDDLAWLIEFALRVASWPARVIEWGDGLAQVGTARLLELPALPRLARFLVLLVSIEKRGTEGTWGLLDDAWSW